MKLKPFFLFLILITVICLAGTTIRKVFAPTYILSLTLLEDAVCSSNAPNTNYGDYERNPAQNHTALARYMVSYMKFNLTQIPLFVSILNATLYLYADVIPAGGFANISIRCVENQTWDEMDITWNDRPIVKNDTDIDQNDGVADSYWDFNVTSWILEEYNDGENNVSTFHVNADHEDPRGYCGGPFESKETDTSFPPQLNITYQTDDVNPLYFYPFGLNSTLNGSICQFTVNFTDETGLSHGFLSWNNSGSWSNVSYTLSGTVDLALWNQTLNATSGLRIEYLFYVNDTNNNWNWTMQHFIYTNTKPIVLVISDAGVLFIGVVFLSSLFGIVFMLARRKS